MLGTMENAPEQKALENSQRAPYQPPQLVDYGNAAVHTQFTF